MLCCTCGMAQRKRRTKKKEKTQEEILAEQFQERLNMMAAATQDVVVIDSIVVAKDKFLSYYTLSTDAGTIGRYEDVFDDNEASVGSYVFVNEMGDKCYFSHGDTVNTALYTRDLVGGEWTKPVKLAGLEDTLFVRQDFPFMMPDGMTFYFASMGEESIGGYDIFVTRYDSEDNRFFMPENIGMPYNSTANDYMYVVDETSQIGWFASDRNQPKDTVCIYIFIPEASRTVYSNVKYTEEQILALSRLHRIADTWRDGSERQEALARLDGIRKQDHDRKTTSNMHFIINDNTVYTSPSQFKVKENIDRYIQLHDLRYQLSKQQAALDKARVYYTKATQQEKEQLKSEILAGEANAEYLDSQIKTLEKTIRNTEIQNN